MSKKINLDHREVVCLLVFSLRCVLASLFLSLSLLVLILLYNYLLPTSQIVERMFGQD